MSSSTGPIASTRSGPVVGLLLPADDAHRQDVSQFSGIAFAKPISGVARFRAPEREARWTEVRDATRTGDIVPQVTSALSTMMGAKTPVTGDDCLNLNVWTPAADGGSRPVMVWIHGGAYVTGTGATPWYNGRRFAANHGVVVVTVNYRLGALGYLDVSRLVPDATDLATPNCGLLDQIAALQWVAESIGSFGGDPSNVTVFGESAGAFSISALLGTPAANGLFRRAILQSGAAAHTSTPEQADRTTTQFFAALDLSLDRAGVVALAGVPIDEVVAASQTVSGADGALGLAWQPTVGTESLPIAPIDAVAAGAHPGIDVLFGTTREEMRMFTAFDPSSASIDAEGIVDRLRRSLRKETANEIASGYLADVPGRSASDTWVEISTDQVFRMPADRLGRALHAGGANHLFAYEFDWATPAFGGVLGSCHALEIPFVFDNLHERGVEMFTGSGPERQAIADVLHQAWASFAHHGDPNGEGLTGAPPWPQWNPDDRATFTVGTEVRVVTDPRGEQLRRWPS